VLTLGATAALGVRAPPGPRHPRIVVGISALLLLMCLSIIGIDAMQVAAARRVQLREIALVTANLAQSLSRHADDSLKEVDVVLASLVEQLEHDARLPPQAIGAARQSDLMAVQQRQFPQLCALSVYDSQGVQTLSASGPVASPGAVLDSATRCGVASAAFAMDHHRIDAGRGVLVGPPQQTDAPGKWLITLSRRVNDADGSFAGVAVASVNLAYFSDFYRTLDVGRQGAIALTSSAGILLARYPASRMPIGSSLRSPAMFDRPVRAGASATRLYQSPVDGIERITSYQALTAYPLLVAVGLSQQEALSAWRADAWLHAGGVALLVTVLGLLGWRLARQIGWRLQTQGELTHARDELQQVNRTLQVMALQDSLTGLPNRRHFDAALESEFRRASRHQSLLALIMIDVDCFKQFNDIYGHPAGDECLKRVADVIQACRHRPDDLVARYGGEEFAVLLPATDLPGALAVAEQMRAAVLALQIRHNGHDLGVVSVSAGIDAVAAARPGNAPLQLLRHADQALYAAKSSGRNCVRAHLEVTINGPE
jgi:diguanylate cyclase (GGDEF)-like protein